jgi:hypothetical protein
MGCKEKGSEAKGAEREKKGARGIEREDVWKRKRDELGWCPY